MAHVATCPACSAPLAVPVGFQPGSEAHCPVCSQAFVLDATRVAPLRAARVTPAGASSQSPPSESHASQKPLSQKPSSQPPSSQPAAPQGDPPAPGAQPASLTDPGLESLLAELRGGLKPLPTSPPQKADPNAGDSNTSYDGGDGQGKADLEATGPEPREALSEPADLAQADAKQPGAKETDTVEFAPGFRPSFPRPGVDLTESATHRRFVEDAERIALDPSGKLDPAGKLEHDTTPHDTTPDDSSPTDEKPTDRRTPPK
ncbi:MAG: hypothetical protein AAF790_09385, partial [Planctomycetota bacterium]